MTDLFAIAPVHGRGDASPWVQRWSHLVATGGTVLDLACGQGRHLRWFAERGHPVTGVDRSTEAVQAAGAIGEAILADIENGPWPLMQGGEVRQFDAVVVTNYLWRPLFERISGSVASGGLLIYETFSMGNDTVGKPSRPDFLLQSGELLRAFGNLHIIAFEEGFVEAPPRFVQRVVATRPEAPQASPALPRRHRL